jgi:tRNA (Thr-GGU) A37 N-methylase
MSGDPAITLTPIGYVRSTRRDLRDDLLGATIVRLVSRSGRTLEVEGLDAMDGTPVVDIKPVMAEFLPRGAVRQPRWSSELMRQYWRADD